jgi:hypothetical protein
MHLHIHIIHEVDDEVIVVHGVVIVDILRVEIVVYQVIVESCHGIDTQQHQQHIIHMYIHKNGYEQLDEVYCIKQMYFVVMEHILR